MLASLRGDHQLSKCAALIRAIAARTCASADFNIAISLARVATWFANGSATPPLLVQHNPSMDGCLRLDGGYSASPAITQAAQNFCSQTATKRRSIRHDNEFSNEILVHEFRLGTAKVRELVNAAHDRLKLAFFNQANDATKIATRSLA